MITIQLCPASELEEKDWWHVDALTFIFVVAITCFGVNRFLEMKIEESDRITAKAAHWEAARVEKMPGIAKIATLSTEKALLTAKISALGSITTSKVDKVKALVALDQLQTLWMDGIWYEGLTYARDGKITIRGSAFDSLLVGEYMLGVRETMNPDTRNDDVRTQLGFENLALKDVRDVTSNDDMFSDIERHLRFELSGTFVEKSVQRKPKPVSLNRHSPAAGKREI
jgi:hypothetical protein